MIRSRYTAIIHKNSALNKFFDMTGKILDNAFIIIIIIIIINIINVVGVIVVVV